MNLHWVDWLLVLSVLAVLVLVAQRTRMLTRGVADFLSANRSGGRYLLTMAEGMAGLGAITVVANWEKYYNAGFAAGFWAQMLAPVGLIIALSGWVAYRFRETRALTMAQFFEMRYSRRFRIFSGILAWGSGVINYGIFPAVTGRFLIYFIGLPVWKVSLLGIELNLTLGLVTAAMLSMALMLALSGGQIAVMVTDFLQGQLTNIVFLAMTCFLLLKFSWPTIVESLAQAPSGRSMINPFDQAELPDFGPGFFFMMAFLGFYGHMAWQGSQGYYSSAKSPHEAKMSRILASWRGGVTYLLLMLLPVCAYVFMHHEAYGDQARNAHALLSTIDDTQVRNQLNTTAALVEILPIGMMGLFCSVMIAAALSTDDTYLHSWGSIFVQDVLLPLRRRPLKTEQHMRYLRLSIAGVAAFAWTFSMLFPLNDYIFMWQQITGAIFLGGAGAVIIGGLYWSRGTTTGAWAAMIGGAFLAVTGILLRNIVWPYLVPVVKTALPDIGWIARLPEAFPLNGVQMSFANALIAVGLYVGFSLWSRHPAHDLHQMLHRDQPQANPDHQVYGNARHGWLSRRLGITDEFTRTDRWIYYLKILWTLFFFGIFLGFTAWHYLVGPWTNAGWARWWWINIWIGVTVGLVTTVWFLIGGVRDLIDLYRTLSLAQRDVMDNGRVASVQPPSESPTDGAVNPARAHSVPGPGTMAANTGTRDTASDL